MQSRNPLLFVWGLVVVLLAAVASGGAHAADPDLGTVDDMLNQRWVTNPVDDLVAANPVLDSNPDRFSAFNYWFYTQDNQITTQLPTQTVVTVNCSKSAPLPQQTRLGRLFALKNDVIINVTPDASNCKIFRVQVLDPVSRASTQLAISGSTTGWLQAVVGDLNHDGYDEVVAMTEWRVYLIVPVDVTDLSKGLQVVATLALPVIPVFPSVPSARALSQPVVGDFDNDGVPEMAWVGAPGPGGTFNVSGAVKVYFASVRLLPNPACTATTLTLRSTAIELGSSTSSAGDTRYCNSTSALAAGNFFPSPSGGTTLAIAFSTTGKSGKPPRCRADLYSYAFDASLTPQQRDKKDNVFAPKENVRDNVQLFATAARFDWFEPQEQAVVAMSGYDRFCTRGGVLQARCATITYFARRWIGVLSFDANGAITIHLSETRDDHRTEELWGLAVGRFNDVTDDVSQYTPRIALLRAERVDRPNTDDDKNQTDILLYSVKDPSAGDFTPQGYAEPKINDWHELYFAEAFGNNLLQAGDLQGRSTRLGAPLVARIPNHLQPRLILSVPPMHVDYVQLPGTTQPTVVNFSVTPASFFASYNTAQTNSTQSTTTETTSYSWALGESVEANFEASIPFAPSISGSTKQSWEQTYNREVAATYDTFSSFEFDASGSTSFSDVVWFNKEDFNIYYYPVLGQTVCPQDKPTCTAAERRPLYVVASGPSNSTDYQIEGSTLEWYQPVHEPGNILSYPWNETLLTNELEDEPVLLSRGTAFATDDHPAAYAALWSRGQGNEQTAGTTTSHSFASSTSITLGTPSLGDVAGGFNITGGFDYNNSNSVSTLNTRLTAVGESTGVAGEKPGTFRDPSLYQYLFQPFIFGQRPAPGTVQNLEPDVDIPTHGILQTQYVTDPVNIVAPGAWWATSPYTQSIDIALNHPRLWVVSEDNQAATLPPECLPGPQCVRGRVPDPDHLWTSQFYWMRGLFVTVNGLNGPQRAQATEGDTVFVQARVYNYSLTAMPPGIEVHAAFYRQEWDPRINRPVGDSVLIEEVVPTNANGGHDIPPFKSGIVDVRGHELPNWVLASTSFATTGLGGRHFVFWVVVWAQDRSGTLLSELPGHGLSAKPGVLKSIGEAPLESATVTYESSGETVVTSFSNNVGFWKQAFYVAPAADAPAPLRGLSPRFQLQDLAVRPAHVRPHQDVVLSALVTTKEAAAEGVVVTVVDETTKKVVDMELLAHIAANGRHHVAIPYETGGCGTHKLQVVVEPGTKRQRKSSTSFTVECETKQ